MSLVGVDVVQDDDDVIVVSNGVVVGVVGVVVIAASVVVAVASMLVSVGENNSVVFLKKRTFVCFQFMYQFHYLPRQ